MHEADVDARLDLLDRHRLGEVRPDAPVLLGRIDDLVVDPAAGGRRHQRVVEEEAEPAARPSTPATSAIAVVDGVDVLEHEAGDDGVERAVGEGQTIGAGRGEPAGGTALGGDA